MYYDVVAFHNKEYVVGISSLLKNDFGLIRWDFESKAAARCWYASDLVLNDSENYSVVHGYDLHIVWYDIYVAVSVYRLNSGKVFLVDASTMRVKYSPGFVSLAGKGTGRVDTFTENFQEFKIVTCVVLSTTLYCESMNYTSGKTIQTMTHNASGCTTYDPPLVTIAESKFYLVATDKKFYVGKANSDSNSVIYNRNLPANFQVYEMRTYPDTNDLYILSSTKLEAFIFKPPSGEKGRHINCNSDSTNLFDRICTTCKDFAPKTNAVLPTSSPPQICKIKNISSGLNSKKRMPTTDYYDYSGWPQGNVKLRCIGDDKKNSTNTTTPTTPTEVVTNTTVIKKHLYKVLGMRKPTLYMVAGILAGMSLIFCVSIFIC